MDMWLLMSMFVYTCAGGYVYIYLSYASVCYVRDNVGACPCTIWMQVCTCICLCLCLNTWVISGEYLKRMGSAFLYTCTEHPLVLNRRKCLAHCSIAGPELPSIKLVCGLVPYLRGQVSRTVLERQRRIMDSGVGNPCNRELCAGSNLQEAA